MIKTVAIVLNTSWNIYNFRLNLARAIKNSGYKVILIAPKDKYSVILKDEFEYYDIYINNKGTNPLQDIKTTIEFYKLYKKLNIDVVLHYTIKPNIYGTIAANLLGIRTINNIAGLGTLFVNQGLVTKIAKFLYKYSQQKANKIFFQNQDDYKMFIDEKLVEQSKCDILPGSGVDIQKFKPIDYEKTDNTFRFLLISRMLWDKGIWYYVQAAKIIKKEYPNVEFELLGFIDYENKLAIPKEQIDKWHKKGYINYLGTSDDVSKQIKNADCVVLPSFYKEGTPRVLLESASMAKPLITTNSVGCKDVVDDGINGYLCKIKDTNSLVQQMEKMINLTNNELKNMGLNSRKKIIEQYDENIVINKYLHILNSF